MLYLSITQDYLYWHYSRAFLELFHVWLNFLWFIVHLFSIPQLMGSWFAPWKRMTEERGETWNMEALATYIIINFMSRVFGFLLKTVIIAMGLLTLLTASIIGFLVYVLWAIAPALIVAALGFGLSLLVSFFFVYL